MISKATIEEVLRRIELVGVVEESRSVVRSGRNFKALCPFHSEKTPSFFIWPDTNTYYCFGCQASGNPITYIMETQGLSFPEAIEVLAQKAGVPVIREGTGRGEKSRVDRKMLYRINLFASRLFHQNLVKSQPGVLEYLENRGVSKELASHFHLGFAEPNVLSKALRKRGVSFDLGQQVGLLKRSRGGREYEFLQNRLVFPIRTAEERVQGFGGRIVPGVGNQETAKYLNSPETPLYNKSETLYGLYEAGDAIRHEGAVFVVEGYLDVIGLHRVGVKNVVATCGTVFSVGHAKRLARYAKQLFLIYDGDEAGKKAAARAIQLLGVVKAEVRVLFLPDGEDPDSFALSHGSTTREELGKLASMGILEHFLSCEIAKYGDSVAALSEASKHQVLVAVLPYLTKVQEDLIRTQLVETVGYRLGIKTAIVWGALRTARKGEAVRPDILVDKVKEQNHKRVLETVDRNLLLAALVLRSRFPLEILADPDVVIGLHPLTVQSVQTICAGQEGLDLNCRNFLKEHDVDTRQLLTEARTLERQESTGRLNQILRESVWFLRRARLKKLSHEIDMKLRNVSSEGEKQQLALAQVDLMRRLNAIKGDTPFAWELAS